MIWFWLFTLAFDLLIPGTMIGFGRYFSQKAPREINDLFGYRTSMSMKNRDTWEFAHRYIGRLWLRLGWVLLPVSAVPLLAVWGRDIEVIGTVGAVVAFAQIVPMAGSIVPTELALKRTFDRNGLRKKET